jgi:catechol 2,3-dioxygenase-like lactoylglutathione lyase family enzyme
LQVGYVDSVPGSLGGVQLNVDDVDEVHDFLRRQGVEVSDVVDFAWGRFCFFSDPDGNGWSIHGPLPA